MSEKTKKDVLKNETPDIIDYREMEKRLKDLREDQRKSQNSFEPEPLYLPLYIPEIAPHSKSEDQEERADRGIWTTDL